MGGAIVSPLRPTARRCSRLFVAAFTIPVLEGPGCRMREPSVSTSPGRPCFPSFIGAISMLCVSLVNASAPAAAETVGRGGCEAISDAHAYNSCLANQGPRARMPAGASVVSAVDIAQEDMIDSEKTEPLAARRSNTSAARKRPNSNYLNLQDGPSSRSRQAIRIPRY